MSESWWPFGRRQVPSVTTGGTGILQRENDYIAGFTEAWHDAQTAITRRDELIAELVAALEPFANMWIEANGRGYHSKSIPAVLFIDARTALDKATALRCSGEGRR